METAEARGLCPSQRPAWWRQQRWEAYVLHREQQRRHAAHYPTQCRTFSYIYVGVNNLNAMLFFVVIEKTSSQKTHTHLLTLNERPGNHFSQTPRASEAWLARSTHALSETKRTSALWSSAASQATPSWVSESIQCVYGWDMNGDVTEAAYWQDWEIWFNILRDCNQGRYIAIYFIQF